MSAAKKKKSSTPENAVTRYFNSIDAALDGLDIFLRDHNSPFYQHGLVARTVTQYIALLVSGHCRREFSSEDNKLPGSASEETEQLVAVIIAVVQQTKDYSMEVQSETTGIIDESDNASLSSLF